jgi:D-alanine-D-alanine ligase
VVILEINTVPALTPATCLFHQAAEIGIKPMDFIDLIITFGLQRKGTVTASTVHDQKHQTTIITEQSAATK